MSPDARARLAGYAGFFETLTLERLEELEEWFVEDARFKDPFNDVEGIGAIRRVFEHMFATCREPRFKVYDVAGDDAVGYLYWDFRAEVGRAARPRTLFIRGVSRVVLAPDGRIQSHVDYWDAAEYFYERLPLLGPLLRAIKSRLRV